MHLRAPTPSEPPLPWVVRNRRLQPRRQASLLQLDEANVASFNALLHELHPDAVHVDSQRLDALADWLLHLPEDDARQVLDLRLSRLQQLRGMLDDPDWDVDTATRARLTKLFAYLDNNDDLIPDNTPRLGLLDDVLLAELAWPVFADEADDYADYCGYRLDAQPTGAPEQRRHVWIEDRLVELAVLRQRLTVRHSHYATLTAEMPFRIGR